MAKRGLLLNLYFIACLIFGCSSSTKPTFSKEDIADAIQDISKNEYKIDLKARLVGQTLWVYIPTDEDVVVKSDKPEKYVERYSIEVNKVSFQDKAFSLEYLIKSIAEQEKSQEYKYSKAFIDKINNVWKVLRRVLLSMDRSKEDSEPKIFCLVIADIKNGFETKELFYYLDIKKVTYEYISWTEYQHRSIEETSMAPEIIGDREGSHIVYRDIPMYEFLALQMQHRIKLKFQKPELPKNLQDKDIDSEILKVPVYTIKTYNFKDFSEVVLNNLLSKNKITLNQPAILAKPIE